MVRLEIIKRTFKDEVLLKIPKEYNSEDILNSINMYKKHYYSNSNIIIKFNIVED